MATFNSLYYNGKQTVSWRAQGTILHSNLEITHSHLGWQIMLMECMMDNREVGRFLTEFTDQLLGWKEQVFHLVQAEGHEGDRRLKLHTPRAKFSVMTQFITTTLILNVFLLHPISPADADDNMGQGVGSSGKARRCFSICLQTWNEEGKRFWF